jgi:type IV pilus assembly protein PilE
MKFSQRKALGFTLIELLIAVAIVGILAAVAYPAYTDSVTRSNRTEGQRELLRIANLQEQFYMDNRSYTTDMTDLGLSASPFVTEGGHYAISATTADSANSFVLKATAKGSQATNDSSCSPLTVTEAGAKGVNGVAKPACWE